MSGETTGTLLRQLDIAWRLASHHLAGLTTAECLWRPAREGLHVRQAADGTWRADWPEREDYDIGPPSIAWLTWHLGFWWTMALDHTFGPGTATREGVPWPGDADGVRHWLEGRQRAWRAAVEALPDEELRSAGRTRWPFRDRPFADVVAWANLELAKNAAEIGYARFLYATREGAGSRVPPVTLTRRADVAPYVTRDASTIRELMHPGVHGNRAQSLAEATVAPGARTLLHRHPATEELYHVTAGTGWVWLADRWLAVAPGDTVAIAPGSAHCAQAGAHAPLVILCACSPAYRHEDTVLLDEPLPPVPA